MSQWPTCLKVKVASKFHQTCGLLTANKVVSEHIFDS